MADSKTLSFLRLNQPMLFGRGFGAISRDQPAKKSSTFNDVPWKNGWTLKILLTTSGKSFFQRKPNILFRRNWWDQSWGSPESWESYHPHHASTAYQLLYTWDLVSRVNAILICFSQGVLPPNWVPLRVLVKSQSVAESRDTALTDWGYTMENMAAGQTAIASVSRRSKIDWMDKTTQDYSKRLWTVWSLEKAAGCFLPLRYVVDWRISWRGSWRMEKPHTANVWLGNNFFFSLGHRSFASFTPKLSAVKRHGNRGNRHLEVQFTIQVLGGNVEWMVEWMGPTGGGY